MLVNLALQLFKRGYIQSIITFENSKGDFNFSKLDKQIPIDRSSVSVIKSFF